MARLHWVTSQSGPDLVIALGLLAKGEDIVRHLTGTFPTVMPMASATMAGMAADPGKDVLDSVGPRLFAEALEKQNYKTVQVDWKPIAGGDREMQDILAVLGGLD